jgi:hypothetical protein
MNLVLEIPDDAPLISVRQAAICRAAQWRLWRSGNTGATTLRSGNCAACLGSALAASLDGFLKAHEAAAPYTANDLQREVEDLRRLGLYR